MVFGQGTIAAGRWFGRGKRPSHPWAVDRREGELWVEWGRYASRREAEAVMNRREAAWKGDLASFRFERRPLDEDASRVATWVFVFGLAGASLLGVAVFVSRF
jgi:hypothetical protein